jgi:hypothetical protein
MRLCIPEQCIVDTMKPTAFLRALLQRNGDNTHSLARKLGEQNMQPLIHRFMTGKTAEPRRAAMQRIADHYEVNIDAFYDEAVADVEWARIAQGIKPEYPVFANKPVNKVVPMFSRREVASEEEFEEGMLTPAASAYLTDADMSHNTVAEHINPYRAVPREDYISISQKREMLDYVIHKLLREASGNKFWFSQGPTMTADWIAIPNEPGPPDFSVECKIMRSRNGRTNMMSLDRFIGAYWRYKHTRRTANTIPTMIVLVCEMDADDYELAEIDTETLKVLDAAVLDGLFMSYSIMAANFTQTNAGVKPIAYKTIEAMIKMAG